MTEEQLREKAYQFLQANPGVNTYYQSPADGQCFLTEKAAKEHERSANGDATQASINTLIANSKNPDVVTIVRADYKPDADFSADDTSITAGGSVTFTDSSTNDPDSWDWNFGDGTAHGTTQNPVHVYAAAGTYTVTLIATNRAGNDSKVRTGYIVVAAP